MSANIIAIRDLYLRYISKSVATPIFTRFQKVYDSSVEEAKETSYSELQYFQKYLQEYSKSLDENVAYNEANTIKKDIVNAEGLDLSLKLVYKLNLSAMSGVHPQDPNFSNFQKLVDDFNITRYYKALFKEATNIIHNHVFLMYEGSSLARTLSNRCRLIELIERAIEHALFTVTPIRDVTTSALEVTNIIHQKEIKSKKISSESINSDNDNDNDNDYETESYGNYVDENAVDNYVSRFNMNNKVDGDDEEYYANIANIVNEEPLNEKQKTPMKDNNNIENAANIDNIKLVD